MRIIVTIACAGLWNIFFITLLFTAQSLFITEAAAASIYLDAGIKHDILDYEENREILLLNTRATLTAEDKFTFNFTGIQNYSDDYFLYTWYMQLQKINNSMDIILGHYNLNFGSGLIMGKKAFVSSDPFSRHFIISKDTPLSPSKNGNPIYSFTGAAADIYYTGDSLRVSFLPFFSCQERFISPDDSENDFITSSLATLNTKIQNQGNDEPVYIVNYGIMASANISSFFTIQAYAFETDLKKADLSEMAWDSGKYGMDSGINKMSYTALFMQYSDSNISIFIEPASSLKHAHKEIRGYAFMYGLAFKSSPVDVTFLGKTSDKSFLTDYSSGSRLPEKTWEIKGVYKAYSWLKLGGSLYSQNYLQGGYNSSYIEGTRKEEISADIKILKNLDMKLSARSLSYYSSEYRKNKYQYIINIVHEPYSFFNHSFKGMIQKNNGEASQLLSQNFILKVYRFTFKTGYSFIKISGSDYIYSGIPPGTGSLSGIYRFNETGYGTAAMAGYKNSKNSFYFRWERREIGEKTGTKVESALTLLF
jgi:hypothetical protein